MKVIVQIPCLNEEETLPETLRDIPREIEGVDTVEILVIDDGSTDRTVEIAKAHGVEHFVINRQNMGLAASFQRGLNECLRQGADIIVNTDGDNQYNGADIPKLVKPIVDGEADVVIGDRQTANIAHFSSFKKFLQRWGSWGVARMSGVDVPDAVSGFRAISREAALKINILSHFSYTVEMLIQIGKRRIAYTHVPIRTNRKTRESRLFKGIGQFLANTGSTAARIYAMHQPLRVFTNLGVILILIGLLPMIRFLYFFAIGEGDGRVQSLIFGGTVIVIGFLTIMLGLLSDLINYNRRLLEATLEKVRGLELEVLSLRRQQENPQTPPPAAPPANAAEDATEVRRAETVE